MGAGSMSVTGAGGGLTPTRGARFPLKGENQAEQG